MRRKKEVAAVITQLAAESFAGHVLVPSASVPGAWRCGRPGDSMHSFHVLVGPGLAVFWGDLGEFVLRHSDPSGAHWLLTAGSRDYVLEKLSATRDPKREFMLGDAHDELARQFEELRRDLQDEVDEDGEPEPGFGRVDVDLEDVLDASQDDDRAKRLHKVRARFKERLDDCEPEAHAWAGAWYDVGESDPPRCEGWSSSALWLWEAILLLRKLNKEAGDPLGGYAQSIRIARSSSWRPADV